MLICFFVWLDDLFPKYIQLFSHMIRYFYT